MSRTGVTDSGLMAKLGAKEVLRSAPRALELGDGREASSLCVRLSEYGAHPGIIYHGWDA